MDGNDGSSEIRRNTESANESCEGINLRNSVHNRFNQLILGFFREIEVWFDSDGALIVFAKGSVSTCAALLKFPP